MAHEGYTSRSPAPQEDITGAAPRHPGHEVCGLTAECDEVAIAADDRGDGVVIRGSRGSADAVTDQRGSPTKSVAKVHVRGRRRRCDLVRHDVRGAALICDESAIGADRRRVTGAVRRHDTG